MFQERQQKTKEMENHLGSFFQQRGSASSRDATLKHLDSIRSGSVVGPRVTSERSQAFTQAPTYNSQADFALRDQTIIIVDWDDTLCPSTAIKRLARFDANGKLAVKVNQDTKAELAMLANHAQALLQNAATLGKVVLVTNAKRPWVDISCTNFLPSLKEELRSIPIIYALELLREIPQGAPQPTCLFTETKALAMKAAVTEFYSRYPNQSWKNIVSIGDAHFEHTAIWQVVNDRPTQKRCRTKTVKLLEGPTIAGMVVQMTLVDSWLPSIVRLDSDVDIDMGADQDVLDNWMARFGSETRSR